MMDKMTIAIPAPVQWALTRLREAGHEAVLVGGCVRDALMGKEPQDYDAATSARPEEIMRVFDGEQLSLKGLKHGTVTLIRDGMDIEITTYRIDGAYADHRRPEQVIFTDGLKEDVMRRDFTINALCYGEDGVIDLVGGVDDIKARIIRCVGDPVERFREDALRIMRAFRFSAVLGFDIEPETARAIAQEQALLRFIAAERIGDELLKLLAAPHAPAVLNCWRTIGFDAENILPGTSGIDWDSAAARISNVEKTPVMLLAALFADCPDALDTLRISSRMKARALLLIKNRRKIIKPKRPSMRALAARLGFEAANQLIALKISEAKNPAWLTDARTLLQEVERDGDCVSLRQLAISGRHIKRMAAEPREIGEALQYLLERVMEGTVSNERGALREKAKAWFAKKKQ